MEIPSGVNVVSRQLRRRKDNQELAGIKHRLRARRAVGHVRLARVDAVGAGRSVAAAGLLRPRRLPKEQQIPRRRQRLVRPV